MTLSPNVDDQNIFCGVYRFWVALTLLIDRILISENLHGNLRMNEDTQKNQIVWRKTPDDARSIFGSINLMLEIPGVNSRPVEKSDVASTSACRDAYYHYYNDYDYSKPNN